MTVYVDDPMNIGGTFNNYCHMWADNVDELHQMAQLLGLRLTWFQDRAGFPHYDISPDKRKSAIKFGAEYVPLRKYIKSR